MTERKPIDLEAALARIAGPDSFLAKASGRKPDPDPKARFKRRFLRNLRPKPRNP